MSTWPESAMTANERKTMMREHWAAAYAGTLPPRQPGVSAAWAAHEKAAVAAAERRSQRLDTIGTLLGGIAIPLVFAAFIWLIAG